VHWLCSSDAFAKLKQMIVFVFSASSFAKTEQLDHVTCANTEATDHKI
jgi:hypothetical protein